MRGEIDTSIQPTDIVITRLLRERPQRLPNLSAEVDAFCELSQLLAHDPNAALHRFVACARQLCNAGSAGISLLRTNTEGDLAFVWEAISGELEAHVGGGTQRHFSPCGLCLDAGATILVAHPERAFPYIGAAQPLAMEALIVPLYNTAKQPLGTIWLVHHDAASWFCANDARVMEQMAGHLVLALMLIEDGNAHRQALKSIDSHKIVAQSYSKALVEERRLREVAEASAMGIREALIFKDALILEVDHRVKNTIQIAANLLSLQSRATPLLEVRSALREGYRRLHVLAKVHELLYTSTDSARQILMPKLLHALADALRQSFAEMSCVSLEIDADAVMLNADDAIPMALLANELLTNAYKHAFPNQLPGKISIHLRSGEANALMLRIADNGVGMSTVSNDKGLGRKLIKSFATRLQGTLIVAPAIEQSGTVVTLTMYRDRKGYAAEVGDALQTESAQTITSQ